MRKITISDDVKDMAAELKAESMRRYGVPAEETKAALVRLISSQPQAGAVTGSNRRLHRAQEEALTYEEARERTP